MVLSGHNNNPAAINNLSVRLVVPSPQPQTGLLKPHLPGGGSAAMPGPTPPNPPIIPQRYLPPYPQPTSPSSYILFWTPRQRQKYLRIWEWLLWGLLEHLWRRVILVLLGSWCRRKLCLCVLGLWRMGKRCPRQWPRLLYRRYSVIKRGLVISVRLYRGSLRFPMSSIVCSRISSTIIKRIIVCPSISWSVTAVSLKITMLVLLWIRVYLSFWRTLLLTYWTKREGNVMGNWWRIWINTLQEGFDFVFNSPLAYLLLFLFFNYF